MTMRRRLPNRRGNETFSFLWLNMRFTATISRFSDGAVAEIFLTNGKIYSHADVMARDAAVAASLPFSAARRWRRCGVRSCAIHTVLPAVRSARRSIRS